MIENKNRKMKFRAHETFFIRKGWLSKGMKYVQQTNGEVFISKTENPVDVLGLGTNMVKALRYWLQVVGLTEEDSKTRKQKLSEIGTIIFEKDRYLEEIGTYQVFFEVSITEAGQLILTLNGADLEYTVVGRATGASQIIGMALVSTTVINSILTVRNPAGNPAALSITPLAGGTRAVSAHLVITRIA